MIAAIAGIASGLAIPLAMYFGGLLQQRAGLAVLVAAIAFFYPVFAATQGTMSDLLLHGAIFLVFALAALWAFHHSTLALIVLLAAHGLLDGVLHTLHHPAPASWPAYCGWLDIVAAAVLFMFLRFKRIPA